MREKGAAYRKAALLLSYRSKRITYENETKYIR